MDYELLIGLLGIVVAIFFGLRGIPSTLSKIEQHTRPIKRIEEIVTRLDERVNTVLRLLSRGKTVKLTLKNVGKVEVSAEPSEKYTEYYIRVEKPILMTGFISKKGRETSLSEKEKELFGQEVTVMSISPTRMVLRVPSTDPKACVKYIAFFLKWLDSKYWEALKELKEYEKITL